MRRSLLATGSVIVLAGALAGVAAASDAADGGSTVSALRGDYSAVERQQVGTPGAVVLPSAQQPATLPSTATAGLPLGVISTGLIGAGLAVIAAAIIRRR